MVNMVRGGEGGGGSWDRECEGPRGREEAGGEEARRLGRSCVLLHGFPWLMLQYVGRLFGMRKGERGGGKGNRRGGGERAGRVGGKAGSLFQLTCRKENAQLLTISMCDHPALKRKLLTRSFRRSGLFGERRNART
jgi:hypothetical protein